MGQIDDAHEAENKGQTDGNDKQSGCVRNPVKENEKIVGEQNFFSLFYFIGSSCMRIVDISP